MTNFEPAPWPDEIQDYFAEHSAIAWVPRFLHEQIADWTETLAISEPDFRYQEIQIWHDGSVRIRLEDEEVYDDGFLESIETMMQDLTASYHRFTQI